MAKQPTQAQLEKKIREEQAANTLLEAGQVKADPDLHKAAIAVIQKRQNIATMVIKGA